MFGRNFDRIFNELFNSENPFFNGLNNNFEKRTYKSEDGSITFTYITNVKGDLNKSDELYLLKQKLDLAVEEQNFEEAVELRDKIKNLEENKEKISGLKKELDECIKTQNFERAIELRDELNSLK
jgi:protein-arginine kinase activator protein McsA